LTKKAFFFHILQSPYKRHRRLRRKALGVEHRFEVNVYCGKAIGLIDTF
jgi:hypothetical protein